MAQLAFISACSLFRLLTLCFVISASALLAQDTMHTSIFFDTDKFALLPQHKQDIRAMVDSIDTNLTITKVTAKGHADLRGTPNYNLRLSERRVQSISKYLLLTYPDRFTTISSQAMGATGQYDNLSPNRRVDIEIIYQGGVKTYTDAIEVDDISIVDAHLLSAGTYLKIKNLNFHPGRSILLESAIPQLKKLEKLLNEHPEIHIQIDGHICCQAQFDERIDGRDIDNNQDNLSLQRAKNIYNYLIRSGITEDRLSFIGYGHSRPYIYPEVTEADRIQNRRVEILITKS